MGNGLAQSIDDTEAKQALAIAQAGLASAKAGRSEAAAGARDARKRANRSKKIADIISRAEVDSAQSKALQAAASQRQAGAEVARQEALIEQLEQQLADNTLRANFDGTVSVIHHNQGTTVASGEAILHLIDAEKLLLRFAVSPKEIGAFQAGSKVRIEIEGVDHKGIEGLVRQIAPELDPSTKMFFLQADLLVPTEAKERVRPGQIGRVHLL